MSSGLAGVWVEEGTTGSRGGRATVELVTGIEWIYPGGGSELHFPRHEWQINKQFAFAGKELLRPPSGTMRRRLRGRRKITFGAYTHRAIRLPPPPAGLGSCKNGKILSTLPSNPYINIELGRCFDAVFFDTIPPPPLHTTNTP